MPSSSKSPLAGGSIVESSSSAGAVTGGRETSTLSATAGPGVEATEADRLRSFEAVRGGRRTARVGRSVGVGLTEGVLESLTPVCRECATGLGPDRVAAPGSLAVTASWLAVQPNAPATRMLAAHAARCSRRRRVETSKAARRRRVSKGVGKDRGGVSRANNAVVRSRSAAIPSRAPWQDAHAAR